MYLSVHSRIFYKEKNSTYVNVIASLGMHCQGKKVKTGSSKGRE